MGKNYRKFSKIRAAIQKKKSYWGSKSLQKLFHSIKKKKKKSIWSLEEEYNLREFLP